MIVGRSTKKVSVGVTPGNIFETYAMRDLVHFSHRFQSATHAISGH